MRVEVCPTSAAAAARAADFIAAELRAAVKDRGLGTVALSGGRTPELMMRALAAARLPWPQIHIFQVDERIVGDDDERRNMNTIRAAFGQSLIPVDNVHPMPVNSSPLESGAAQYSTDLGTMAGAQPSLDVVHLGLGEDGHTASLVAGDGALASDSDVAITGLYKGVHRMTLTLQVLDRARRRIWLVTGSSKRDIVRRFLDADPELVASRVRREAAILVLDDDAAGERT